MRAIGFLAAIAVFGSAGAQVPLDRVLRLSAGYQHTCAVREGGSVACWGYAQDGQLGNGASGITRIALATSSFGGPARAVASGFNHSCIAREDGAVWCFGTNNHFQLGTTSVPVTYTPIAVANVANVQSLAVGDNHTCALTGTGGVVCWGGNFFGMLGNGSSNNDNPNPGTVSTFASGAAAIGAGQLHTCALTTTGAVRCWGLNLDGQLGDGTQTMRTAPVTAIASGATAIAVGATHTCALMANASIQCWGYNASGELGDGTTTSRLSPVTVANLGGTPVAIGAGDDRTCAVLSDASVKCWGVGPLGNGTQGPSAIPTTIPGVSPATAVAPGGRHTCVLRQGGTVACWGSNQYGQTGDNQPIVRSVPVPVVGLPAGQATAIAVGEEFSCAIVAGATRCWGRNTDGRLGTGATGFLEMTPQPVAGLQSNTAALALTFQHACAIDGAGGARCWGANEYGELGDLSTTRRNAPVSVSGLASGLTQIAVGMHHSCALTNTGRVACWGQDWYGQRGDGAADGPPAPSTVENLASGALLIGVGGDHACAVNSAGQTRCWGRGDSGQLGNDRDFNLVNPVPVDNLVQPTRELTLGTRHTCAVGTGGDLRCWGFNQGRLGDGTSTARDQSVAVIGLSSGVQTANAGDAGTCAVAAGGSVQCWGSDVFRVYGNRDTQQHLSPVPFAALGANVRELATGNDHGCAIVADGSIRCWGDNFFGQLGDGTSSLRLVPAAVLFDAALFKSGFESP